MEDLGAQVEEALIFDNKSVATFPPSTISLVHHQCTISPKYTRHHNRWCLELYR